MALFGGHYNRKPRQFEYRPLYYDPEKEERERKKAARAKQKSMAATKRSCSFVRYTFVMS